MRVLLSPEDEDIQDFQRERKILRVLGNNSRPKILLNSEIAGELEIGSPWPIQERVKGQCLLGSWTQLDRTQPQRLIADLAAQIKEIHSYRFQDFALPPQRYYAGEAWHGHIKKMEAFCQSLARRADFPALPANVLSALFAPVEGAVEISRRRFTPVLLHRDLLLGHIYWDGRYVTGIIDWGWAAFGPAEYDFRHRVDQVGKDFALLMDAYGGIPSSPALECDRGLVWFDAMEFALDSKDLPFQERLTALAEEMAGRPF